MRRSLTSVPLKLLRSLRMYRSASRRMTAWRRETDAHREFDERRYDQFRVLFEGREEKALARQATDVFHLALFAYYWLGGLLPHGFPGEGLESFEYQLPKLRIYAPRLPPGIAAVLTRGMALDPRLRS